MVSIKNYIIIISTCFFIKSNSTWIITNIKCYGIDSKFIFFFKTINKVIENSTSIFTKDINIINNINILNCTYTFINPVSFCYCSLFLSFSNVYRSIAVTATTKILIIIIIKLFFFFIILHFLVGYYCSR